MNNITVAHLWATQARPSARGSHFYFRGPNIYSYGGHFLVATIKGKEAHFNPRRYSSSTSRHQSIARNAAEQAGLTIVTLSAP